MSYSCCIIRYNNNNYACTVGMVTNDIVYIIVLLLVGSVSRGAYQCAESAVEGGTSREGNTTTGVQSIQETQSGDQSHDQYMQ